jgi:hypothetical protein
MSTHKFTHKHPYNATLLNERESPSVIMQPIVVHEKVCHDFIQDNLVNSLKELGMELIIATSIVGSLFVYLLLMLLSAEHF